MDEIETVEEDYEAEEIWPVEAPVLDPKTGEPLMRLGLRESHLFWLVSSVLQERGGAGPIGKDISLADGRTFHVRAGDIDRIHLASIVAGRGEAVDLPLTDGTVVAQLRSGEIADIARQMLAVSA